MSKKYRVILVDDNKTFLDGIRVYLNQRPDFEILGEAYDGNQFLELLKSVSPDFVLMDINMPNMDGRMATKKGFIEDQKMIIIGVTMSDSIDIHLDMLHLGFSAGILKDRFVEQFNKAIIAINKGDIYFPILD